jgi:hypothetical protein
MSDRLGQILSPILLMGTHRHDLLTALYNLCSAALDLSLKFRASKTKYEFKIFNEATRLSACDKYISPQDAQGHISSPLDYDKAFIFCTLFGALVKTRPIMCGGNGESVILDRAHVIITESQEQMV